MVHTARATFLCGRRARFRLARENLSWTRACSGPLSDVNLLSVDMTDWGGLRRARECSPWQQIRKSMADYRSFVRRQVIKLCPWHLGCRILVYLSVRIVRVIVAKIKCKCNLFGGCYGVVYHHNCSRNARNARNANSRFAKCEMPIRGSRDYVPRSQCSVIN